MVVVLTLLLPGAALAQEVAGGDPAALTCTVLGYDVIIRNPGSDPIGSGASLEWSVPFARMEGSHVLTAELEPEGRLFLSGILGSNYLDAGAECTASVGDVVAPPQ
jgi:hypothetical protein